MGLPATENSGSQFVILLSLFESFFRPSQFEGVVVIVDIAQLVWGISLVCFEDFGEKSFIRFFRSADKIWGFSERKANDSESKLVCASLIGGDPLQLQGRVVFLENFIDPNLLLANEMSIDGEVEAPIKKL
jgi:hypothetical protein